MGHPTRLLIRADAGPGIGSGHLMRCLALVQAWRARGGEVTIAAAQLPAGLERRVRDEGAAIALVPGPPGSNEDATATRRLLLEQGVAFLVVDGYVFREPYLESVRAAGCRVLWIVDHADLPSLHAGGAMLADLLLDQSALHTAGALAASGTVGRALLGPRFALLRREFLEVDSLSRRASEIARRLLVTFGAFPPPAFLDRLAHALGRLRSPLDVVVAAGQAAPPSAVPLRTGCGKTVRWEQDVRDMPLLMAEADLALAAAGSTCWELCFVGVPSVLVVLAENQERVAKRVVAAGAARQIGWYSEVSPAQLAEAIDALAADPTARHAQSEAGRFLVDGRGAARVVYELRRTLLTLRRARPDDCRLLWEWANDVAVRASSFSPEPIPWQRHVEWYRDKMADDSCLIYIALDDQGRGIGQIRFDAQGGDVEIAVSVSVTRRGEGWAPGVIAKGTAAVFAETQADRAHAWVKLDNLSSQRAFEEAGFVLVGDDERRGHHARHYVLVRAGGGERIA